MNEEVLCPNCSEFVFRLKTEGNDKKKIEEFEKIIGRMNSGPWVPADIGIDDGFVEKKDIAIVDAKCSSCEAEKIFLKEKWNQNHQCSCGAGHYSLVKRRIVDIGYNMEVWVGAKTIFGIPHIEVSGETGDHGQWCAELLERMKLDYESGSD